MIECPENSEVRILLVGDQQADQLGLEAILDGMGAGLVITSGVEGALRELLADEFAVVLVDMTSPGMNSLDAERLTRERKRGQATPIVFILAREDDPGFSARDAYALGAADCLVKPISSEFLRPKVAVFLEMARRTRVASLAEDAARERLAEVLSSMGDMFLLFDRDLRIAEVNEKVVEVLGKEREHFVGALAGELFADVAGKCLERGLRRVIDGRTPVQFESYHASLDRWFDHRALPAGDGAMLVITDVTAARKAEELRQHFSAVVRSSEDAIVSKRLDGTITSWNLGAERVFGYTAEEAIGNHVSMLMAPESVGDTEKILGCIRRGELVEHYLTKRKRKDGSIIDVSVTVSPIRDARGEIIGATKVGRDVTEANRMAELKERLAAIVESSDDIIVSKTLDGVITSWNRGAQRILGYAPEDVLGKHVSMLMPPGNLEDTETILGKIRRGQKVDHYETRRRRKDGRIIDVSLTVSPVRDSSGRIIGASKIGRDITEQKRAEAERVEADRRKDEFLAMLAHELRNPLSSINSAVQLFGKLETEEELEWAKEIVQRQVKHLGRLIDDLLDVSRISRGKISLRSEIVDLSPIVSCAVEAVRPLLEERKHELSVSLVNGGLQIEADPVRLEQILVNLLTNSAKYTDAGGKIAIDARKEEDEIVIKVRDTGMGISPELMPRIFDLFSQGDRTMARSEGGLGIGLTLVQKLAAMHGGSVSATSDGPGKGSEFTVRLPAHRSANIPKARASGPLPRVARSSSRVMVVDDNLDNARGLSRLLKLLGHEVQVAFDGPAAIDLARTFQPEILLLDIGLPGMDGYDLVRRLRAENFGARALIIAVSGYGQPEDLRRSREAGFDHHLVKPIDYDALMSLFATQSA